MFPTASVGSPDGADWEIADQADGCLSCHLSDAPVTISDAGLSIIGLPERPTANERYALTVVLEDPQLMKAGFLLSIRSASGRNGELAAVDGMTEAVGARARSNWDGSRAIDNGRAQWQLVWTTPAELDNSLDFVLWGNVGNDDLSPLGDSIRYRVWQLNSAPR